MTTLTVGTNDTADNTGDLIITFVDMVGTLGLTTDGTRPALPGAPWGCYLVAPNISPQPGCMTTFTPAAGRWGSCSLIWQPPPHAAVLWTAGGGFGAAAGVAGNPKFPATTWPVAATANAAASIAARAPSVVAAAGASLAATAGFSGSLNVVGLLAGAPIAAGASIAGMATGPGATAWQVSGAMNAAAGIAAPAQVVPTLAANIGATAGVIGAAQSTSHNLYNLGQATLAAAAGINANCRIGHQYAAAGRVGAVAGVIPFGGNAPIRVTNYVQNPQCQGAVVGTSTLAPEWYSFSTDLTLTVIGQGTENQIPYTDIRLNNPASGGGSAGISLEGAIITGPGLIWSFSTFARLVGGSTTNLTYMQLSMNSLDSNFNQITHYAAPGTFMPSGAGLQTQWFHFDGTNVSDAGTTYITFLFEINYNAGAIDFTIRLGGACVENATASSGSQYIVVPQSPAPFGGSTSFVY